MGHIILTDFGSTFTKVTVVSPENQELVYTTKAPSTVNTDASLALEYCLEKVKKIIGNDELNRAERLVCSSAAGGLRMVVVGLTPYYSLSAGRNAALGAGARVQKVYTHKLSQEDIEEIEKISPEIILLCGGTDEGNSSWVLENAVKLSSSKFIYAPIVFAGNKSISNEIRKTFMLKQKECLITENIFPDIGMLNVTPASESIRNIFMKRIVNMKGLDKVKDIVGENIIPTPSALLLAGKLLSQGIDRMQGLGDLMIVDIGGATTDVYSYSRDPENPDVKLIGAPEPFAKRTVEGDLGMRSSSKSLSEAIGWVNLTSQVNSIEKVVKESIKKRKEFPSFLPDSLQEEKLDFHLAKGAANISASRHAGRSFNAYSEGTMHVQKGKNLKNIELIVGTGGPIINSPTPKSILESVLTHDESEILLPLTSKFFLDENYVLYAIGLLAQVDAPNAFAILKNSLLEI